MKISLGHSAVVALLVVSLAGCAPASPAPTATPAAGATPVASATPAPTPTPTATPAPEPVKPALEELVITTEGLDSLVPGQAVPTADPALALVEWDGNFCQTLLGVADSSLPGSWLATYPNGPVVGGDDDTPFIVLTAKGKKTGAVQVIRTGSRLIGTPEGIRPGSTLAQLKAAYPAFDDTVTGGVSKSFVVDGDLGRLVFEVAYAPGSPGYWPASLNKRVLWISAIPIGADAYTIAGSDGGGPCPV